MRARRERRVATVRVTLTMEECALLERLCSSCDDTPADDLARDAHKVEIKLFRARRFALRRVPVR